MSEAHFDYEQYRALEKADAEEILGRIKKFASAVGTMSRGPDYRNGYVLDHNEFRFIAVVRDARDHLILHFIDIAEQREVELPLYHELGPVTAYQFILHKLIEFCGLPIYGH